jgi:uncharacterized membrane protein YeaQ/YmgE (transglycosylase-associated protein family)
MTAITTMGGRKFMFVVLCVLLTAFLTWTDKLDAGAYTTIILGIVGVYIAGNVTQAVKRRIP